MQALANRSSFEQNQIQTSERLNHAISTIRKLELSVIQSTPSLNELENKAIKTFQWPPENLIRSVNSLDMVESFKLRRLDVKLESGKILGVQISLGDGQISPVFGLKNCNQGWEIEEKSNVSRVTMKYSSKGDLKALKLIER